MDDDGRTDADHFQYEGHDFDPEVGLQYHQDRHFDPTVGRWINEDPVRYEASAANLYRYVGNAPCDDTDPSVE